MTTSTIIRTLLIGSTLAAAISANAVLILIDSVGHATGASGSDIFFSEKVVAMDGGLGHLNHLNYTIDTATNPLTGTGVYSGAHGDLDFSFTYDAASVAGSGASIEGTWMYTGGTGNYADLMGNGTLALTGQVDGNHLNTITSFQGSLEAVPEPAPFAALGLGAMGLLIRRRKNA